jgi:hypothetical protein
LNRLLTSPQLVRFRAFCLATCFLNILRSERVPWFNAVAREKSEERQRFSHPKAASEFPIAEDSQFPVGENVPSR